MLIIRRKLQAFEKVKELINSNVIDKIVFADIQILQSRNKNIITKTETNRRLNPNISGGGYFHDMTLLENLSAIGEVLIVDKKIRYEKIDSLISKFELDPVREIKAAHLSGGQKKKLVIALSLLGDPNILLLDEPFAALDVMTIKTLQNIIVNLQTENNMSIILCDHQARDLLSCVDVAIVLSNCKIIANGTPSELINNDVAKSAYFGESFKIN